MVIIPPRKYQWTGARMEVRRTVAVLVENPWKPCGWCQGQRQIVSFGRFVACPNCLGIGDVPSAGRAA